MADSTWPIVSVGILTLLILLGVLVIWRTVREKKSGFPLADERTQKVKWKAGYYAMFMCQYFILAYLFVDIIGREFFGTAPIEAGYPMIAALLVSAVSFGLLQRYLGRTGEP